MSDPPIDDSAAPRLGIDLGAPPSIPHEAMGAAAAVMESGWLHRYGETLGDFSEVSLLEEEFAALVSRRFAVAMNSCGSTMFLALKCCGVEPGDKVLMNAFTLAPVPGAVAHAGAEHVLVESRPTSSSTWMISSARRPRAGRGTSSSRICAATSPTWTG